MVLPKPPKTGLNLPLLTDATVPKIIPSLIETWRGWGEEVDSASHMAKPTYHWLHNIDKTTNHSFSLGNPEVQLLLPTAFLKGFLLKSC